MQGSNIDQDAMAAILASINARKRKVKESNKAAKADRPPKKSKDKMMKHDKSDKGMEGACSSSSVATQTTLHGVVQVIPPAIVDNSIANPASFGNLSGHRDKRSKSTLLLALIKLLKLLFLPAPNFKRRDN